MTERVQTRSTEVGQPAIQPDDCTAEQFAEIRYGRALDDLVTDAADGKLMHILADSLAWTFARISVRCGVAATGDMLRRVGAYVGKIESQRRAAEEAQQALQEGRLPS